jgi:hypothetical protein
MPKLQVEISEVNDKHLRERLRRKGDLGRIVDLALEQYFEREPISVNAIVKRDSTLEVDQ